MKLQFTERVTSTSLAAEVGGVKREFKRSDEPFEVDEAEGEALVATGYFEACEAVVVRFKQDVTSPQVDIASGTFRRKFVKAEQPFEVTRDAWERYVEPAGYFEVEPEKAALKLPKRTGQPQTVDYGGHTSTEASASETK